MTVFIVQADHFSIPGRKMEVFASEASANAKAAEWVADLVRDACEQAGQSSWLFQGGPLAFVNPGNWPAVLDDLQRRLYADENDIEEMREESDEMSGFDASEAEACVWIVAMEVQP